MLNAGGIWNDPEHGMHSGDRMDQTRIGPPAGSGPPAPSAQEILQEFWREIVRLDPEAVVAIGPPAVVPLAAAPSAAALTRGAETAEASPRDLGLQAGPPLALPALLELDGVAFIAAAYGAVLGRLPDEAGIAAAEAAMALGFSKVAVLGSLQQSPEGRASGRVIPGLRTRARAHAAYRLPVLGRAARLGAAVLRRSGLLRRLAWMQFEPRRLQQDPKLAGVTARLDLLEAAHLESRQAHAGTVADHQARVESLAHQVAVLGNEHALTLDRLGKRLDMMLRQMAALDERITSPLVGRAGGLEAQRRTMTQIRADLEAEQRRTAMVSDQLRRELETAQPALSGFSQRIARQA